MFINLLTNQNLSDKRLYRLKNFHSSLLKSRKTQHDTFTFRLLKIMEDKINDSAIGLDESGGDPSTPTSNVRNENRRIQLIHMNREPRFKTLGCTYRKCIVEPLDTYQNLVKHTRKCHNKSLHQCEFCGLFLETKKDLTIHEGIIFIIYM